MTIRTVPEELLSEALKKAVMSAPVVIAFLNKCQRCNHVWPPRANQDLGETDECPNCVLPGELMLGDNVPIEAMAPGAQILGANGVVTVVKTVAHSYEGDVTRINGAGLLPFAVTGGHKILVCDVARTWNDRRRARGYRYSISQEHWVHARELHPMPPQNPFKIRHAHGHYLVMPRIASSSSKVLSLGSFTTNHGRDVTRCRGYPLQVPLSPDVAWVLGLYVADGHGAKKELGYSLNFDKDQEKATKVEHVFHKLGYGTYRRKRGAVLLINITSRLLSRAFKSWCGASSHTKHVPDFILGNRDKEILRAFMEGYVAGDGCSGKKHKRDYFATVTMLTVSRALALGLQLVLASLGVIATVHKKNPPSRTQIEGRWVNQAPIYYIRYSDRGNVDRHSARMQLLQTSRILIPIRSLQHLEYQGNVHDVTTSDATFLVGNVITHNCHSPYWRTPRKQNT